VLHTDCIVGCQRSALRPSRALQLDSHQPRGVLRCTPGSDQLSGVVFAGASNDSMEAARPSSSTGGLSSNGGCGRSSAGAGPSAGAGESWCCAIRFGYRTENQTVSPWVGDNAVCVHRLSLTANSGQQHLQLRCPDGLRRIQRS
jgi:hypothetical protein